MLRCVGLAFFGSTIFGVSRFSSLLSVYDGYPPTDFLAAHGFCPEPAAAKHAARATRPVRRSGAGRDDGALPVRRDHPRRRAAVQAEHPAAAHARARSAVVRCRQLRPGGLRRLPTGHTQPGAGARRRPAQGALRSARLGRPRRHRLASCGAARLRGIRQGALLARGHGDCQHSATFATRAAALCPSVGQRRAAGPQPAAGIAAGVGRSRAGRGR